MIPILLVKTKYDTIKFYCPGIGAISRAESLFSKEPETIRWIDSFKNNEIFWDIGSNIGVYSLYAARKGHQVLSFEPAPANYNVLNKNIEINKLDNKISAYCLALNDKTKLDIFNMYSTEVADALNSFGRAIDAQGNSYIPVFKQAMMGINMDSFIEQFKPSFPNHIKIDVDGNEDYIIKGCLNTLKDKRLKSILIELDSTREEYSNEIFNTLINSGFTLLRKDNISKYFPTMMNYIFVRE
jgi:FkbM family methyltransferase